MRASVLRAAIPLPLWALLAGGSPALGEVPRDADGYVRVHAVDGHGGNYAYALYLDPQRDRCVDVIPSTEAVSASLYQMTEAHLATASEGFRVKLAPAKVEVHPPSIQVRDGEPLISSAASVFHRGRQIFLQCHYLSKEDYEVFVAEDAIAG